MGFVFAETTNKFRFDAPERADKFKPHHRAAHALRDLYYALATVPSAEVWESAEGNRLRCGFLHGFREFVRVLRYIHGIDTFGRQTNVHIEYEQEWEATFNLQLRLDDLITQFINWAASDVSSLLRLFDFRKSSSSLNEDGCFSVLLCFLQNCRVP